jgi:hypothetical protein
MKEEYIRGNEKRKRRLVRDWNMMVQTTKRENA